MSSNGVAAGEVCRPVVSNAMSIGSSPTLALRVIRPWTAAPCTMMSPAVIESPRKLAVQKRLPTRSSGCVGGGSTVSQISTVLSGVLHTRRSVRPLTLANAIGETCGLSTLK